MRKLWISSAPGSSRQLSAAIFSASAAVSATTAMSMSRLTVTIVTLAMPVERGYLAMPPGFVGSIPWGGDDDSPCEAYLTKPTEEST